MIYQEQVARKIQSLPDSLLRVVDLFVDFLLLRYRQTPVDDDLNIEQLAHMAAAGGAFDWLDDAAEDAIYSDADGEAV